MKRTTTVRTPDFSLPLTSVASFAGSRELIALTVPASFAGSLNDSLLPKIETLSEKQEQELAIAYRLLRLTKTFCN